MAKIKLNIVLIILLVSGGLLTQIIQGADNQEQVKKWRLDQKRTIGWKWSNHTPGDIVDISLIYAGDTPLPAEAASAVPLTQFTIDSPSGEWRSQFTPPASIYPGLYKIKIESRRKDTNEIITSINSRELFSVTTKKKEEKIERGNKAKPGIIKKPKKPAYQEPKLEITGPTGKLMPGKKTKITWKSNGLSEKTKLKIKLFREPQEELQSRTPSSDRVEGKEWERNLEEFDYIPNDGEEEWVVPKNLPAGEYYLQIKCAETKTGPGPCGEFMAKKPFKISAPLELHLNKIERAIKDKCINQNEEKEGKIDCVANTIPFEVAWYFGGGATEENPDIRLSLEEYNPTKWSKIPGTIITGGDIKSGEKELPLDSCPGYRKLLTPTDDGSFTCLKTDGDQPTFSCTDIYLGEKMTGYAGYLVSCNEKFGNCAGLYQGEKGLVPADIIIRIDKCINSCNNPNNPYCEKHVDYITNSLPKQYGFGDWGTCQVFQTPQSSTYAYSKRNITCQYAPLESNQPSSLLGVIFEGKHQDKNNKRSEDMPKTQRARQVKLSNVSSKKLYSIKIECAGEDADRCVGDESNKFPITR